MAERRIDVGKIIEDQLSPRLDLRSARPRIGRYVGIGMPGVDINPVEIAVSKFRYCRSRQAVVTFHARVGRYRLVELRIVDVDKMQFLGHIPREKLACKYSLYRFRVPPLDPVGGENQA